MNLAPWLTPAMIYGSYACLVLTVGLGTLITLRCIVAAIEEWPDRTTPEEDAEQMSEIARSRDT